MGASTAYGILKHYEDRYKYDYEFKNRFYKERDKEMIQPHRLVFMVVRKSMQIRYFTEIYLFFILACYFQYNVYSFSTEYNVYQRKFEIVMQVLNGYEIGTSTYL